MLVLLLGLAVAIVLYLGRTLERALLSVVGPRRVRLVTHLDVDDDGAQRAADVVGRLLAA